VYTATPWRWHVPVCLAAMENGKHAATEVPAAITIEEAWRLVEASETRQRHCVMMENVCYGRTEMMVLNMVRQGLLGEILHAECGYLHDLRAIKFADEGEGLWRRVHSAVRDGNLYPTHGLGPVAQCMNVNRGDRLVALTSLSSPSRGLQEYAREHYPAGHPKRREEFVCGDVNSSLIRTARGRTVMVSHDTDLPRPYSRINKVQGTRGLVEGWPHRVHVEGRSPAHEWEEAEAYFEEFEHPLWRRLREDSEGAGHGGMDFIEDWRLIQCLRRGEPLDMDVYDAAAWSAVSELSERSVAAGGAPMEFPDFTRGRWREWPPLEIVEA
ncbi:MAG: Gfo/Idh/MocA family protein, partial [Acidobacteriota bacterium]